MAAQVTSFFFIFHGITKNEGEMPAKPGKIKLGSSQLNQSDLSGLRAAWNQKRLVLFLGAGVSIPYGVPSWKDLVLELLFEQAEHTRRLGTLLPHYRRALASWMTDYFEYNPLVLARMVERDLRKRGAERKLPVGDDDESAFLEKLRAQLYSQCKRPTKRTALQAIANLIKRSRGNIRSAFSFNFDSLLEEELKSRRVKSISVADGQRQYSNAFRIIHPHGFVPRQGEIIRGQLVFTEDDYHKLTETVFHWGLSEIVMQLRQSTVLFVGLSMSDPSLRRLLDAAHNDNIPQHWQLQRRHQVRDHEKLTVINDVENRARRWGQILGSPQVKTPPELSDAVDDALKQADTYDRELFESMGVKTIWLESFDDIPGLIDAIGG